jgi:hypothetical protein
MIQDMHMVNVYAPIKMSKYSGNFIQFHNNIVLCFADSVSSQAKELSRDIRSVKQVLFGKWGISWQDEMSIFWMWVLRYKGGNTEPLTTLYNSKIS